MSKVSSTSTAVAAARRRDSSEDFGAGSLGSIGGSIVGSSVASAGSSKAAKAVSLAIKPALSSAATPTMKNTASNRKNSGETVEISSMSSSHKGGLSNTSSPPIARRPFRKRKGSVDFALAIDNAHSFLKSDSKKPLPSTDALPSVDALHLPGSPGRLRSLSFASGLTSGGGTSLEHLDALGEEADAAAAKIKVDSNTARVRTLSTSSKDSGNSGSQGTMTSQSHRFLLEALMGEPVVQEPEQDGAESLVDSKAAEKAETFEFKRERLNSFDGGLSLRDRSGSFDTRRQRLDSWGGMSDLSIPLHDSTSTDPLIGGAGTSTAAALAATIYTTLANDVTAAATQDCSESISSFLVSDDKIPTKITTSRDRVNSITSFASEPSASRDAEIPSDIQQFVKAAMASVNEQLVEIAVAATEVTKETEDQSELSSTASPMIGAASDTGSKAGSLSGRPRASSLSNGIEIAVDLDAVNAALNAADAAAGEIHLAAFNSSTATSKPSAKRKRAQLPLKDSKTASHQSSSFKKNSTKKSHIDYPPIPKSKLDDRDMERIRERARAAAGYVPPSRKTTGERPPLPLKKKIKMEYPSTPGVKPELTYSTPKTVTSARSSVSTPYTPALSTPGSVKTTASKGQSSQKWDSMFDCLLQFIEERRKTEIASMKDDEKKTWTWDGNVPTTYKTKDGKALGRWVNNQRSAKSKGVLKEDREKRLVDAGLKWSVLASNSWNEMLAELRIYVAEQTKAGRKWDGNVPTNYRIKTKSDPSSKEDEDKNLGRWVNRQRSLYQAGKLRKDRQVALEKVGLKWSMLATTSWESMFDTLCEYVQQKTKDGAEWDGNVPANYRTMDNPPRALGRWINRQRSAYGKKKLKQEYTAKLNKIGLKWSVHERRPVSATPDVSTRSVTSPAIATPAVTTRAAPAVPTPNTLQAPHTPSTTPKLATDVQTSVAQVSNLSSTPPVSETTSATGPSTDSTPAADGTTDPSNKVETAENGTKEDAGKNTTGEEGN